MQSILQILKAALSNPCVMLSQWRAKNLSIITVTPIFVFFALGGFAYAQNSSPGDSNFTEAFRKLKRNDSLQFDFTTAPPLPETPEWLKALGNFFEMIFKFLAPILHGLFYIGIGALLMAFIYLVVTTLMAARLNPRAKGEDSSDAPLYRPQRAQALILLDEIDALAAQGKYAEAVHTLLFRSIQDIDANRPNVIRRSLTSREIGGLTALTSHARQVFSSIASVVERSFFGGQDIGKIDFDTARAAYAQLAIQPETWAASETQTA